jgi:hypothetical protein
MIDALTGAAFVLIVFGIGMVSILLFDAVIEWRNKTGAKQ